MSPQKGEEANAAQRARLDAGRPLGSPAAAAARAAEREAEDTAIIRRAEELTAERERIGPGALSTLERHTVQQIAHMEFLRRDPENWLRRYGKTTTAAARAQTEQAMRLTKLIGELYEQLERATRERITAAQRPNAGQSVQPRSDPMSVLRMMLILLKQGALPASPETRGLGDEGSRAIERDLRTLAELGDQLQEAS
jgi:hypothetical protein